MENIIFDFYNDTFNIWLQNFCEYFNLNFKDAQNYFNSVDIDLVDTDNVVKSLNINLNNSFSSNVKIMIRHMTTSTEKGLESFRKHGLLDLKRMLKKNTTLSEFLNRYGIVVDVDNKVIYLGSKKYPILSNLNICPYCLNEKQKKAKICTEVSKCEFKEKLEQLSNKLYNHGGTVEYFINSSINNMKNYSSIYKYPEILDTIGDICSSINYNKITARNLGFEWMKEKSKTYIIECPVILSDMDAYNPIDYEDSYNHYRYSFITNGYNYNDYINGKIPKNILDNIMLIKWFINGYFCLNQDLSPLLPDKYISPEDITIIEVNNEQLIYL